MSLLDAVRAAGAIPTGTVPQHEKKRYSEVLSRHLAWELAAGLRGVGFDGIKPERQQAGEKEFQGGLGSKRVDVSCADERHGLMLAVSIKSISFAPFGKNLKNRFGDLCTEAITLHMRFPYSVICMLFAFPADADADVTRLRTRSTFQAARRLFATISGRDDYTGPGEKFEHVAMLLFSAIKDAKEPSIRIFDALTEREFTEPEYFEHVRQLYNARNPHAPIGEEEQLADDADPAQD